MKSFNCAERGRFDVRALEELLHMIQVNAWSLVYPEAFGNDLDRVKDSLLMQALDRGTGFSLKRDRGPSMKVEDGVKLWHPCTIHPATLFAGVAWTHPRHNAGYCGAR